MRSRLEVSEIIFAFLTLVPRYKILKIIRKVLSLKYRTIAKQRQVLLHF